MNLYFGRQKSEIWMKLCFNNISDLNYTDEIMTKNNMRLSMSSKLICCIKC